MLQIWSFFFHINFKMPVFISAEYLDSREQPPPRGRSLAQLHDWGFLWHSYPTRVILCSHCLLTIQPQYKWPQVFWVSCFMRLLSLYKRIFSPGEIATQETENRFQPFHGCGAWDSNCLPGSLEERESEGRELTISMKVTKELAEILCSPLLFEVVRWKTAITLRYSVVQLKDKNPREWDWAWKDEFGNRGRWED